MNHAVMIASTSTCRWLLVKHPFTRYHHRRVFPRHGLRCRSHERLDFPLAEAMREISSRLEEMPGEEGYLLPSPVSLSSRAAGRVETLNGDDGQSPSSVLCPHPVVFISEPVAQGTSVS